MDGRDQHLSLSRRCSTLPGGTAFAPPVQGAYTARIIRTTEVEGFLATGSRQIAFGVHAQPGQTALSRSEL